jgi:hypothetical protein
VSYVEKWGNILKPYKNKTRRYLEIGLLKGVTLPLWQEYFNCEVHGIDVDLSNLEIDKSNFFIYEMDATDSVAANRHFTSEQFHVIVDDSSPFLHVEIFEVYEKFLAKGGIYIIETFKPGHPLALDYAKLTTKHKHFEFNIGYSVLSKQPIIYGYKT